MTNGDMILNRPLDNPAGRFSTVKRYRDFGPNRFTGTKYFYSWSFEGLMETVDAFERVVTCGGNRENVRRSL